LSPDQIFKAVDLLARFGFDKIKLTGGEPTLRSDLDAIIALLNKIPGVDLSLITNGTLLTRERLARYRRAGLPRINVTLNTFEPGTYCRLMGGNNALLEAALASIPEIIAAGYERPKVNLVYRGPESDRDLEAAIRLAQACQIKITLLNIIPTLGSLDSRSDVTTADLIDKVVSWGVESVYVDHDACSFSTLCFVLRGGAVIEIGHHQVGQANVYKSCATCSVRRDCQESIFAQRLTPDGFLQPCLVRADNCLDLRSYLWGEVNIQAAENLVTAFLRDL
jgi:cyclic pyranopterin phosphate synthase